MKPLERNERVCVDIPTQMLILMEQLWFISSSLIFKQKGDRYGLHDGEKSGGLCLYL
jgi:hypothetical protein